MTKKQFANEYLGQPDWSVIKQMEDKSSYKRCKRCKELEPFVKEDWPFKGLCSECVTIERKGMKHA